MDVLDKVNKAIPGPFDIPLDDIRITKCGTTDHLGRIDAVGISADRNAMSSESPDNAKQLKLEAQRAQDDLKSVLAAWIMSLSIAGCVDQHWKRDSLENEE